MVVQALKGVVLRSVELQLLYVMFR